MREFSVYVDEHDTNHIQVRNGVDLPWYHYLTLDYSARIDFVLEALREKEAKTNA